MVDKIDDIINSLEQLKKEKLSSEEQSNKIFNLFKSEQDNFNNSAESIYEKIESLRKEVNQIDEKRTHFFKKLDSFSDYSKLKASPQKSVSLPSEREKAGHSKVKIFHKQESLLSELMKKNNYQTIYNIFLSFLLINIAIYAVQGVIEGKFILNFSNFFSHFDGGFQLIKFMFLKQLFSIFSVLVINFLIANIGRQKLKKINLFFIISIKISFAVLFSLLNPDKEFSMLIRIVHFVDNLRCLSKVLSYYIEKVLLLTYENMKPDLLAETLDEEVSNKACILADSGDETIKIEFRKISLAKEIKNFLYFYYAPTLIFRDAYPRSEKLNVFMIFIHFVNLIFSITFLFVIIELKFFPLIQDKNFEFLKKDFILTLVTFCLYSMILLFVVFFGFFHSYFNLFAEILRFADKNFYSDFFNSLNPSDFMLKLSYYYDDFFEYYLTNILKAYISKEFGKVLFYCFFLEYILSSSMNNFCPVISLTMLFCYLATYPFKLIDIHQKQYLNWLFVTFFTGFSVLVLYIEYIIKFNGGENNYIAYGYVDEIMKKNSFVAWLLPKIVFYMF
jgi:sterol O-acyltransferase